MIPSERARMVCFHLDLSVYGAIPKFAPAGNYIGSLFLKKFIEHLFSDAGVGFSGMGCFAQPLNDCSGLWVVEDVPQALRVLQEGLDYFELLGPRFAEVGYFDPREEVWRSVYPANSQGDIGRHFGKGLEVFVAKMGKGVADMSVIGRALKEIGQP